MSKSKSIVCPNCGWKCSPLVSIIQKGTLHHEGCGYAWNEIIGKGQFLNPQAPSTILSMTEIH